MNALKLVLIALAMPAIAFAQSEKAPETHDHGAMHKQRMQPDKRHEGMVQNTSGKVTKVDFIADTISIIHQPIPSMGWPAMNMEFRVKEKAMLDKVRPNMKVDFTFTQTDGHYVITEIK